jgi:prepilin-type N-terminal cleavage/methylation domain-containing protein
MTRGGFTLIELLVATLLVAVLMSSVVLIAGGLARDQRDLSAMSNVHEADGAFAMLRYDLLNSRYVIPSGNGATIIGHAGLDPNNLTVMGRPTRVIYRVVQGELLREQQLLDDPARPQRWTELVSSGVTSFAIEPASADPRLLAPPGTVSPAVIGPVSGRSEVWRTPSRVHLRITHENAASEQMVWLK